MAKKVIQLTESEMAELIQKTIQRALNEEKEKSQTVISENLDSDQIAGLIGGATGLLGALGLSAAQLMDFYKKYKTANPNADAKRCLKAAFEKMRGHIGAQL